MPPKKKNNKKAQDDWEADLGETIAPNGGAPPAADADAANEDGEEEAAAGGLMAMLRKNKQKRKDKGLPEVEAAETPVDEAPVIKTAQEANMDDEFALPEKKGKGGKGGKQAQQKKAEPQGGNDDGDGSGRILTKAEKEKLKKEREKQRKKENAAKKKTEKPEPAKAAAPEKKEEAAPTPAAAAEPAAGGKKKKIPAHLLMIQKQQEELRRRQEEEERAKAEAKRLAEEQDRMDAEEIKRREEAKALKKQKEKEKIEQLKKEGKFMTKAQKEEKARNEKKLQQMLAAGIKVGPQEDAPSEPKKKNEAPKKKSRQQQKIDEEKALAEAAERARVQAEKDLKEAEEKAAQKKAEEEAAIAAQKKAEESDVEDDWEAAAASDEDVKDSWDADSDEEGKAKETKKGEDAEEEDEDDDDESDEDDEDRISAARAAEAQRKKEAAERREKAHQAALAARSKDNLRSPICCILGHVDTGKTKLLDKVRQTNVQEGEAGGITQQIGATYFPVEALKQKTAVVNKDNSFQYKVPGLLVIDTPGHESFSNLRSRGSSLCNIAILVVDIMHGLEPQTRESIQLLKDRKTPFIVALNKIDRLYGWKKVDNNGFQESLRLQNKAVHNEFQTRLEKVRLEFSEVGFNSFLYYENPSLKNNVSLVPTSAHTGEGVPDMLKLILHLTQERMTGSLMYLSEVQATVLEVKAIEGFGMTIDVILSNGILREGDRIVLCGTEGAIKTNIRALLTPQPLRELRLKSQYIHNKEVKAALGVKISAPGLEGAIAGSRLMVVGPDDDEEDIEDEVESDLANLLSRVEKSGKGVTVQASTLGSLEALLDFLKDMKIPVANVGIGPVYKRDVMQSGIMLERAPDYAIMLCFDVKVDKEAQAYADEQGVKIFTADIIYHLFDSFTKHMEEQLERKKEESKMLAVFPCVLKPVAVFNKTGPIVIGVDVTDGQLKINTPIAAIKQNPNTGAKEIISLGRVTSIERDHKQIPVCKKGQPSVAVKIEMGGNQPVYGRQLEETDTLYSLISRASIDTLKEFYRKDVSTDEWKLIVKLKPMFDIN